jgi:hypothetical protein
MVSSRTALVVIVGFLLLASGLSLWVLGDQTTSVVSLPLASTGVTWAPLLWICGIIVMLSAALANTLPAKNYLMWLVTLIVGYLVIFGIIVAVTSQLLP